MKISGEIKSACIKPAKAQAAYSRTLEKMNEVKMDDGVKMTEMKTII